MLKLDQDFVPSADLKVSSCHYKSHYSNSSLALWEREPCGKVDPGQVEHGGWRGQQTVGGKELLYGDKCCLQLLALRVV